MKAAVIREFGGPDVLSVEDVDDPQPGPGHVRIDVATCALNHVDVDIREGTSRFPIDFPHIQGLEIVGRVDAIGDGVDDYAVGDRVMPYLLGGEVFLGVAGPGGFAEYAIAPTDAARPRARGDLRRRRAARCRSRSAPPGTCSSRAAACASARRCS